MISRHMNMSVLPILFTASAGTHGFTIDCQSTAAVGVGNIFETNGTGIGTTIGTAIGAAIVTTGTVTLVNTKATIFIASTKTSSVSVSTAIDTATDTAIGPVNGEHQLTIHPNVEHQDRGTNKEAS